MTAMCRPERRHILFRGPGIRTRRISRSRTQRPEFRPQHRHDAEYGCAAVVFFVRKTKAIAMTQPASHLLPVFARIDLAFERGEGVWLHATNGDRYLDFTSGIAVNALGHGHPHLAKAIGDQAAKLMHVSNLFRIPEGENARRAAVRGVVRRLCLLRQFRRRSDGRRHQAGAQISGRQGQARALSHHHV